MSQDGLKSNATNNNFGGEGKANLDFRPFVEIGTQERRSESLLRLGNVNKGYCFWIIFSEVFLEQLFSYRCLTLPVHWILEAYKMIPRLWMARCRKSKSEREVGILWYVQQCLCMGKLEEDCSCPFKKVAGDRRLVPAVAETPASSGTKEMWISLQRVKRSGASSWSEDSWLLDLHSEMSLENLGLRTSAITLARTCSGSWKAKRIQVQEG